MHRSRFAGFIVDCKNADLPATARFWGNALGMPPLEAEGEKYFRLDGSAHDLVVEVQSVDHESRVHLDIESDDVEAEVKRLEALGAKRVAQAKTWWVMEAPTGQRFCVVRAKRPLAGVAGATPWP
jgi:hypothetical protein